MIDADAAAAALLDAITDPELRGRTARGEIDAVTDNVALTGDLRATHGIVRALTSRR